MSRPAWSFSVALSVALHLAADAARNNDVRQAWRLVDCMRAVGWGTPRVFVRALKMAGLRPAEVAAAEQVALMGSADDTRGVS